MDAANPLSRSLLAAALFAAVGCTSTAADRNLSESDKKSASSKGFSTDQTKKLLVGRGQLPDPIPPRPPAPIAPATPSGTGAPVSPGTPLSPVGGAPVAGQPVSGPVANPPVQPIGYAMNQSPAAVDPLKDSIPQIKVVALVGTTGLVTDQEVVEAVRQRPDLAGMTGHQLAAKEKELYAMMLRKVIERELVLDDMYAKLKKNGKTALIEEIKEFASKGADRSLRAIRREIGLDTDEKFQMWLRAQGLSEPVIRRQIERQAMADEYIRSAIREKGRGPGLAEIRAYYDQHPDEFKADDRVKWLDIFISVNKHANPEAARAHAEQVRSQAVESKMGPAVDFVELCKKYDNGLAIGTNGVGVGSKRGQIQPVDVEATVWSLKPGEVSGLIATPAGYHIVKVVERDYAGPKPFDVKVQADIREKLLTQFREAEYKRVVEDLWRKSGVRVIQ